MYYLFKFSLISLLTYSKDLSIQMEASSSCTISTEPEDVSWEQASFSQSLASFHEFRRMNHHQRDVTKQPKRVQFKNEVVAFHVDHDFWKFKCEKEPLMLEGKRKCKSLENLKAIYNDKLVNVKRTKRAIKA